jgi:hypothetical protein
LEYYIQSTDTSGKISKSPEKFYYSSRICVKEEKESNVQAQPEGCTQKDYRLISFPFQFESDNARFLFETICGAYDPKRWKLAEYLNSNDDAIIFPIDPRFSDIKPGKGFWFLISKPDMILNTGGVHSTTIHTNQPFQIKLNPGWNIIGNPFNYPISRQQLCWMGAGPCELWSFYGNWNDQFSEQVNFVNPWEGYLVKVTESNNLIFYPSLELKSDHYPCLTEIPKADWKLQICAIAGDSTDFTHVEDKNNYIGVSASSHINYDVLDFSEPPAMSEYLQVVFPHLDWEQNSGFYCTDFHPAFDEGDYWDFELRTNISQRKITLILKIIPRIAELFDVYLIDKELKGSWILKNDKTYSFISGIRPTNRHFRLIIGSDKYFQEHNFGVPLPPNSIQLFDIFPNPSNSRITIYFSIPSEQEITLEIFNILGQRVKQLLYRKPMPSGYHQMIWDGLDSNNRMVSSGIYIIKLDCNKSYLIKKMAITR